MADSFAANQELILFYILGTIMSNSETLLYHLKHSFLLLSFCFLFDWFATVSDHWSHNVTKRLYTHLPLHTATLLFISFFKAPYCAVKGLALSQKLTTKSTYWPTPATNTELTRIVRVTPLMFEQNETQNYRYRSCWKASQPYFLRSTWPNGEHCWWSLTSH